ncbi:ankyrin [Sphingobium sp. B2D3A]|uniref:ankyrin repeat domain-containing protein n=1 Tax=unclassified Sphingobium TaxID=2611147 RepID=UPI002225A473|nr:MULTISPECIES: ankyrin repeat domain-containing protein [unclassified Sphingobium]MCW2335967.1 ankyrin [Sphingobium sp. B2D3A]MCW2385726.1 ankyrin [Sphingobium sp. B2D3D]
MPATSKRIALAGLALLALALVAFLLLRPQRPVLPPAKAQELGVQMASAARDNQLERMYELVDSGANLDARSPDGTPALHWLARRNLADDVDRLLDLGANAGLTNEYGLTPLHVAAEFGASAVLRRLLRAGAPVDTLSHTGQTALMIAAGEGDGANVKALLAAGANPNFTDKAYGQTPLMLAVRGGSVEAVQALIEAGANVNAATKLGRKPEFRAPGEGGGSHGDGIVRGGVPPEGSRAEWPGKITPLHLAAREGTVEMAKALVEAGAKIEQPEANDARPLLVAVLNDNVPVAQYLLDKGANPNAADWYGRTPLWAAVDVRNMELDTDTAKQKGVDRPRALKFIGALLNKGANPNARVMRYPPTRFWLLTAGSLSWVDFTGQTAFLRAALSGDVDAMKLLASKGADPNITTNNGTTPLMAAAGINWVFFQTFDEGEDKLLEAVRLCHERFGQDLNATNAMGLAAVHGAANRGSNKILAYLASKGARFDIRDAEGRTPYTWAKGVFLATTAAEPKPESMKLIEQVCARTGQSCGIN